ncbi:undecaprenyl-phosphate glucose phosphotransferase [candidate division KSB1 bacterium]|nr:undecaprenyl-phosphate glucose phosphotransferase [candidate division KSB1 bacterium]
MKKSDQKLVVIYFLTDLILLNFSIFLALFLKYGFSSVAERHRIVFILYNIIWLLVVFFANNRIMYWRNKPGSRVSIQIRSFILFVGIVSFILISLKALYASRLVLYGSIGLFFMFRMIIGYIVFRIIAIFRRQGQNIRRLLILGAGKLGKQLHDFVGDNQDLGYQIVGFLDDAGSRALLGDQVIGDIESLDRILQTRDVDEIIIALPLNREAKIRQALERADYYGVRIRLIPDYCRILDRTYANGSFGDLPTINVREVPLDDIVNAGLKRIFDVAFSLMVLILLAPVYLVIVAMVYFEDRGPVFYTPIRIGKNGIRFRLFKFRTMSQNDDSENGSRSTVLNDPRVTRIGRVLRKYSLDELPQFLNVLKGDMSIVGPRPHRVWLNEDMQHDIAGYMTRHYLLPGITGWAQVNGWRGPTDSQTKKVERTRHDLWYMENWSLLLDIKIIMQTVFSKKVHENAF